MVRSVIAVIGSYIVMLILAVAVFSCAYLLMGADRAFKSGSFEPSTLWIATQFGLTLVVSIIVGLLCAAIARGGKVHVALAVIVLALGILIAVFEPKKPTDNASLVRAGNLPNFEAMQKARPPFWLKLLNPCVGAVGVLIGGKLKRRA